MNETAGEMESKSTAPKNEKKYGNDQQHNRESCLVVYLAGWLPVEEVSDPTRAILNRSSQGSGDKWGSLTQRRRGAEKRRFWSG